MLPKILIFYTALILIGCTASSVDIGEGKKAVAEFRQKVARSEFDGIYDSASADFKKTANKEDFIRVVNSLKSEIGNPENFALADSKVTRDYFRGTFLTMIYRSTLSNGVIYADEFVFIIKDDKPTLYNYRFDRNEK